jgi:tetratricopeptide (TPR) repeat protein
LKKNLPTANAIIIVLGILLTLILTISGYKTSDKEQVDVDPHVNSEVDPHSSEMATDIDVSFDEEIDLALENIEKGKLTGDMSLVMNEGIMKLLGVTRNDSNNLRAIYYLGLFSLESGQLEKAEKRFEKLVSLQPQNEEYSNTLQEIRNQIVGK